MTDTNGMYTINKNTIIELLQSTNVKGIDNLIDYMITGGFFDSPASTKYHGCYEGGLAEHSLSVYNMFLDLFEKLNIDIDAETIIITSLLHDLCKIGAYQEIGDKRYIYNNSNDKGHALLSIKRIKYYIELSFIQEQMIKYHMGMYGTNEFSIRFKGEYSLQELIQVYNENPLCKILYLADELATQKEKIQEGD